MDIRERWSVLKDASYDGILASTTDETLVCDIANAFSRPCSFIAYPQENVLRTHPLSVFVIDNERDIAHTAIGHMTIHCHPQTIAYVPTRHKTPWSAKRQKALSAELKERKRPFHVFEGNGESRNELIEWIHSLAKPIGIIAAYDDRGRDVIECCRAANISIGKDVSVLGIGNDEQVCEMATPRLTSIAVDFEGQGYRAARELQAMMLRERKPLQRTILCGTKGVALRGSTSAGKADSLTTRALEFINDHFTEGITTEDVVRHMNVSRSLVFLRFKETQGITILDAILSKRLGEIKRLLETTDKPISEIANNCGYRDANYLKNLFRKKTGMSMRDWRKNKRLQDGSTC